MLPETPLDPGLKAVQGRARRVPLWLRLPILLGALALVVYWIATDSGPYGWAAGLQARLMHGEHYLMLSGAIAVLVALLPAVALVQGAAFLFPEKKT